MDEKIYKIDIMGRKTRPLLELKLKVSQEDKLIALRKKIVESDLSIIITNKNHEMRSILRTDKNKITTFEESVKLAPGTTDLANLFNGCRNIENIELSNLDTSQVTSLSGAFKYCNNLRDIKVSCWNTAKVKDLSDAFSGCENIKEIDISKWDTSEVMSFYGMFSGCKNLECINGVIDMRSINFFQRPSGDALYNGYTPYGNMFKDCNKLKGIKIKNPPAQFMQKVSVLISTDPLVRKETYGYEQCGLHRDQFEIVE